MEKPLLEHIAIAGIIVLVAGASYGIGRLTLLESRKTPVTISFDSATSTAAQATVSSSTDPSISMAASAALAPIPGVKGLQHQQTAIPSGETPPAEATATAAESPAPLPHPAVRVVASKKGKKYYYENCSGAKSLSAANKVYFNSAADAESIGLTLAAGCKAP